MSEYDSGYGGEQNLYANGPNGGVSQNSGGSGGYYGQHQQRGSGGGGYQHNRHGSNAGGGQGWDRQRGARRSGGGGGGGGWSGRQGGGEGYGGGGGGGGRHGNRERDVMDAEEYNRRRLRDTLFRLGDQREGSEEIFHPPSELFRLKEYVEKEAKQSAKSYETILNAFEVMATEQPHKTALTASLLGFLVLSPSDLAAVPQGDSSGWDAPVSEDASSENVGKRLVLDLVNTFRQSIDSRLWRNAKLLLSLFTALLPLGIIHAASLRAVLTSFASVLDEPGVSAARGDRAAICIIEILCRAGVDLYRDSTSGEVDSVAIRQLDDLVEKVGRYASEYRTVEVDLVQPFAIVDDPNEENWFHEESFEAAVIALNALQARAYSRPTFLATPLDLLPPSVLSSIDRARVDAISLPELLIPPDDESSQGGSIISAKHNGTPARSHSKRPAKGTSVNTDEEARYRAGAGVERVYRYPNWFKGTVPIPSTPESIVLRSIVREVIDLYQVNRKEAARILLDMARWHRKGTFIGRSITPEDGIFGNADDVWQTSSLDGVEVLVGGWSIDELVVECILSASLVLPRSPQKPVYYTSLLREVVTLAPQSIAPAMGKSVRRVYGVLGSGRGSAEAISRFADWFSVHLSNFNFGWNWKEWIPDVDLCDAHPKIAFARRIIELEIRLAYHERIKQTLPVEIQQRLLPAEEPSATFTYVSDGHPFNSRAMGLVQSMRARAAAEVILAELQSFRQEISPEKASSFVPSDDDAMGLKMKDAAEVELVICDVVIQVVLHLGSRSFSHFLNVVERYHGLLRQLSSSPAMRLAILASTVRFWAKSAQWTLIVVDKWLQYRIVEPTDIVEFAFASPTTYPTVLTGDTDSAAGRDWSSFMWWELIRLTVHKVHGRVNQVRRRLDVLQREEYEREAREEIARESAAADGQSQQDTPSKPSLFPAGATASTLPRRPDLPPAEAKAEAGEGTAADKKQTAEELKASLENIVKEERKVLIHTLTGFVKRLSDVPEAIWRRNGQDVNDQHGWQSWWLKEWYVEYCRLFSKELKAHHETILANAMSDVDQGSPIRDTFERACQMAME